MGNGQAQITPGETTDDGNDELIALLVPPPQPRWKAALYVALLGVVVAVIAFASTSGLVVPRVRVTTDHWQNTGKTRVITFEVRNTGRFTETLEGFNASSKGLSNAHAFLPNVRAIAPGKSVSVPVVVTIADCGLATNANTNSVRLRITNGAGVAVSHSYGVDLTNSWVQEIAQGCGP